MSTLLQHAIEQISERNILHSKKINKTLKKLDEEYFRRADVFLTRYAEVLKRNNQELGYAVDCYLKMIADINYETIKFAETKEYSSKSFEEVNQRVYNNPGVMEYYMHGLLLSQFLWKHHYDILLHFNKIIASHKKQIHTYLEVGGGHGLYISEAIQMIGDNKSFDLVDISSSSLEMARKLVNNDRVNYHLTDIFDYAPTVKYDFITMGEVLEHVEDPVALLQKLGSFLSDDGKIFITTPTNAPTIDHIYLFKNIDQIKNVIDKAGLRPVEEVTFYSEDVDPEIAERFNISILYGGLLTKK
jgi:2-polyprenyl-3-methyl-5-hydroxy-6-metoxy-1,4-benzoquinol methylase